ncbi:MAG: hypothetical protein E6K93_06180 [Thaumarchaeota archaeon]|nr:MAG: hypothetical protein E6K93_06180 [Nitrososphaerota archaeon]
MSDDEPFHCMNCNSTNTIIVYEPGYNGFRGHCWDWRRLARILIYYTEINQIQKCFSITQKVFTKNELKSNLIKSYNPRRL